MERLLHYVWKYKLYSDTELHTTDGLPIMVLDPGIHNPDAGPDFFNAKLKIGDTTWAGNIEIHTRSSDWNKHGHQHDKNYDTIILHVIEVHDTIIHRNDGTQIPHLVLPVPEQIRQNIDWLLHQDKAIPCLPEINQIDPIFHHLWMDTLLNERLERKTQDIFRLLETYKEDWNEVFYVILTRNFGFGTNSDAFEWLARNLPLRYILKHRGNLQQVEALLLGQGGLLNEENSCEYYQLLQKEYQFLKHKFKISTHAGYFLKKLRIRPTNFPHIKLAQLAAILTQHDTLFSIMLDTTEYEDLKKYLRVPPSDYWKTHYHFGSVTREKDKPLGEDAIRIILINTVIPILFAYGKHTNQGEYCERALQLFEKLPPEKNHITTAFSSGGLVPRHAGESQALIQLKREYCEKKKCLFCRIGFRLLKRTSPH